MNAIRLVMFVMFAAIPAPLFAEARACTDLNDCMAGAACIEGVCQDSGSLVFDARWTTGTDVDLHVMLPDGTVISPQIGDSRSAQGGRIRRDDCYQNCTTDGQYHEQIGWELCQEPPTGIYRVWVENFNGLAPAEVQLTINSIVGQLDDITLRLNAAEGAASEVMNFEFGDPNQSDCVGDADEDGICDLWEVCGVDGDGDGIVDWRPVGADPYVKDVFVELDYQALHNHWSNGTSRRHLVEAAIQDVQASFARAPFGEDGVRLHMDLDDEVNLIDGESTVDNLTSTPETLDLVRFGRSDLPMAQRTSCRDGYYGTREERSSPNCEAVIAAKRKVVRYGYLANRIYAEGDWITGAGMVEPNDAFMTGIGRYEGLSADSDALFTKENLAAVIMHELGHTLGLEHGGQEDVNCKNNYFSVMNYLYMFDREGSRPLDYSRSVSLPLDPRAIVESHGVATERPFRGLFWSNGEKTKYERRWHGSGMIDFDSDGEFEERAQEIPVGHMPDVHETCAKVDPLGVIRGHNDWANMTFSVGLSAGSSKSERGMSLDALAALEAIKDDDGDAAVGLADNCPGLANDQTDADEDGVGDACDACPTRAGRGFEDGCPFGAESVATGDFAAGGVQPSQGGGCSSGGGTPVGLVLAILGALLAFGRRRRVATGLALGACVMGLTACNIEDDRVTKIGEPGGDAPAGDEFADVDPWDVPEEALDWYDAHAGESSGESPDGPDVPETSDPEPDTEPTTPDPEPDTENPEDPETPETPDTPDPESTPSPYTGLLMTQIGEGTSYNKLIEIHNATESPLSLDQCSFDIYFNGSSTVSVSYALEGTIEGGSYHITCNSRFGVGMDPYSHCDEVNGLNFNGDDAIVLSCDGHMVDVVGRIGEDPGDSWTRGGVSTRDQTMIRKCDITEGDTDGTDPFYPDDEFIPAPIDYWDDIYVHCGAVF